MIDATIITYFQTIILLIEMVRKSIKLNIKIERIIFFVLDKN